MVTFPNLVGLSLAATQLSLFARFGIHTPKSPSSAADSIEETNKPEKLD